MQFLLQLTVIHPTLLSRPETTVKIENPPYMSLTVENIGLGPRGFPALSICHYGELNGDLMRDPEMCFEMEIENGSVKEFHPYYYRNDYVAFEQFAVEPPHRREGYSVTARDGPTVGLEFSRAGLSKSPHSNAEVVTG